MDPRSNSLAVTASELERIKSITENTEFHDFVSSYQSIDTVRQQNLHNVKLPCSYFLRQTGPQTQSLIPTTGTRTPSYTITVKGKKKKHRTEEVLRQEDGSTTQVAKFEDQGRQFNNIIRYKDVPAEATQLDDVRDMGQGRYRCSIDGEIYIWEQLGPSRIVMALFNESSKRMALFVYSEVGAQRSGSLPGNLGKFKEEEIGQVHIMDDGGGGQWMLERMLFTAVVMVGRAKRWSNFPCS